VAEKSEYKKSGHW